MICLFTGLLAGLLHQSTLAQEIAITRAGGAGGTRFLTQRVGGFAGGAYIPDDLSTMLALPQFVEELKIKETQQKELAKVREDSQKAIAEAWNSARKSQAGGAAGQGGVRQFNAATWQKTRGLQQKAREEAEQRALAVLTDSQKSRLKEIRVQLALRNRGVSALGASGPAAEAIQLTDEQKKQLRDRQREIQQELQKILAELKEEMEQEALEEVLTDTQLETLKKLRGEHYEVKRPDYSQLNGRRSEGPIQQGAQKLLKNIRQDFEDTKEK